MTTSKKLLFTGILIAVAILAVSGIGLILLIFDEMGIEVEDELESAFESPLEYEPENEGNGFTGQAAAWVFGVSSLPVTIDLIYRHVICRFHVRSGIRNTISRLNAAQRKYLMPFHTYLSILALALGILHLRLSSCSANPLPEWGLIGMGILVGTGLMIKLKLSPTRFRRGIYKFHASLIVSGILATILLSGHLIMD